MTPRPSSPLVLPDDEPNRRLVEHTHPRAWQSPRPASRYNLVVVGGGTAGLVSAAGAAGLGARVALVERHLLGGDCLNVGCVPSKTIIRAGRAVADARDAAALGVDVGPPRPDFAAVMARMRQVRADISAHDSAARLRDLGVDVFLGDAVFTGRDTVGVGEAVLRFSRAVIATGARPAVPPIPGLAEAGYLTNESVFSLTALPARLAVIGGGPIGCELAQAFARLGAQVTIIEAAPRLLPREDADVASVVAQALRRDGVTLVLGARVTRVDGGTRDGSAMPSRVHLDDPVAARSVEVEAILVAAGRAPNVEDLGLDAAGVAAGPRGVVVDARLRTTNRRIYAAGDVCLEHQFTHAADRSARIVLQNALFRGRARWNPDVIPRCTYTEPEVAGVGLSQRACAERGLDVDAFMRAFADVDRARTDGDTEGFARILVRRGTDTIVGCTIVGRHAGEQISEVSVAMAHGVGLGRLARVVHPYPTRAAVLGQLGDAYARTRLTPRVKRVFSWWFRVTR